MNSYSFVQHDPTRVAGGGANKSTADAPGDVVDPTRTADGKVVSERT